jgi:hypothetical protein
MTIINFQTHTNYLAQIKYLKELRNDDLYRRIEDEDVLRPNKLGSGQEDRTIK